MQTECTNAVCVVIMLVCSSEFGGIIDQNVICYLCLALE